MLININEIKVGSNRREALPEDVKALSKSFAEVGMMNPITVDVGNNLVAGLHRLEAAKLLGWTEIECNVCKLDELHAELAEIDENVVRTGLSDLELSELLARRKKIYETLHPETIARNLPGHASNFESSSDKLTVEAKTFSQDTAEKMGVSPRTVERHVQIAENLTPEAKEVLRNSERKVTKQNLTKLSRMEPEQQEAVAKQLAEGKIKSADEYAAKETPTAADEDNYYKSAAFIVDCFADQNSTLRNVPNKHRIFLKNYRKIMTREHIKSMIDISNGTIKMLQDYISFLENELRVLEETE